MMERDEFYLILMDALMKVLIREGGAQREANAQDCNKILQLWMNMVEERISQNRSTILAMRRDYEAKKPQEHSLMDIYDDYCEEFHEITEVIQNNALDEEPRIQELYLKYVPMIVAMDPEFSSAFLSQYESVVSRLGGYQSSEISQVTPASLEWDNFMSYSPVALGRAFSSDMPLANITISPEKSYDESVSPQQILDRTYTPPQQLPTQLQSTFVSKPKLDGTISVQQQRDTTITLTKPLDSASNIKQRLDTTVSLPQILDRTRTLSPMRRSDQTIPKSFDQTFSPRSLGAFLQPMDPLNRRLVLDSDSSQLTSPEMQDPLNRCQALDLVLPQLASPAMQDPLNRTQVLESILSQSISPALSDPLNRRLVLDSDSSQLTSSEMQDPLNRTQVFDSISSQSISPALSDPLNRRQVLDSFSSDSMSPVMQDPLNRHQALDLILPPQEPHLRPENARRELFDQEWFARAGGAQIIFAPSETPPSSPGELEFSTTDYYFDD